MSVWEVWVEKIESLSPKQKNKKVSKLEKPSCPLASDLDPQGFFSDYSNWYDDSDSTLKSAATLTLILAVLTFEVLVTLFPYVSLSSGDMHTMSGEIFSLLCDITRYQCSYFVSSYIRSLAYISFFLLTPSLFPPFILKHVSTYFSVYVYIYKLRFVLIWWLLCNGNLSEITMNENLIVILVLMRRWYEIYFKCF